MSDVQGKKIRLYFVLALAYPLFRPVENAMIGGAEVNLYNLAVMFADDPDYEVTFLVGDYGQPPVERFGRINVRKMKYLNYDPGYEKFERFHYKILRELYLLKELLLSGGDIFINSCGGGLVGHLALICGKIRRKKVLFRLASDADADPRTFRQAGEKIAHRLYQFGLHHADSIVSQTENQKALLRENTGLDSTVIRNGFFLDRDVRVSDKKLILWVSRAVDMKRPELFLAMAERLPEEEFIIIIPGKNQTRKKAEELAEKLKNVKLIDHVPFFEIQDYYDRAKLFVNTSEYEGFPNSFIQACLGKTPILTFRVNPDDFVNRYNLGCCCEDSVDKAIEFIRGLDASKVEFYGGNAFQYALANHDIRKSKMLYESLIRRLVN